MLQDLNNKILNWLESVSVDSHSEREDLSAIRRPRKRVKLNNSRAHAHGIVPEESDKKRDRDKNATDSRLPTPSASVSPTASHLKSLKPTTGPDTATTMPPANNKRPRGRPGPDDDVDSTISAKPIRSAPGFSQPPSLPASKASKVSNNSSPTRQIRNAGLQPSGFITASFKHDPQPDSLKRLCSSLELIHAGFGILPKTLQESLIDEDDVFEWMFGDEPKFGQDRLPTIWAARQIWRMAARCDGPKKLPESAWNNDVHSRVLDWVFRDGSANNGFLDYRSCFNAAILPEYQPESSPTKMVDYCVCLQPEDSSLEYARIEQLCRQGRPGQSINHTDWGDLVSYPIGISIETKGPGITYETALVQVATWHAAQWRSIFHNRERHSVTETSRHIPFLPGIIVIKHDWYFVATDRDGMGKARTFEKKTLGSTESLLGIYKLMMALQRLAQWLVDEFWPTFQVDVLGLESDFQ